MNCNHHYLQNSFLMILFLSIFLYNRLSRTKYNQVKKYFLEETFDFTSYENITHSFNDVFGSFNPEQFEHVQEELRIPKVTVMPKK